jgi:ketosteroid isomerase-like protein
MNILHRYIKATNTHDFDEVKKVLHPDAVYFFTDQTCRTHDEIRLYFENAWKLVENENYEAHDAAWIFQTDTSATCTYTFYYEGYVQHEYTSGRGRATNVFVKESDEWLLIHEHLSSLPANGA